MRTASLPRRRNPLARIPRRRRPKGCAHRNRCVPAKENLRPRKIDAQNRVVLPQEVVRALRIAPGDYVVFENTPDGVRLHRRRPKAIRRRR